MADSNRWLLPDGIEEVLPPWAWRAETLRRKLLDLYHSWGYELVIPPYIEYLESLLTGIGSDLDIQTFKVTDQLTGRMMGIRADMTPQVARIDAHSLPQDGPARFCYGGSVLHTRAANLLSSRSPIQMGAELFGCDDLAADTEIISLMLESLQAAGAERIHLDIGHVAVYRELVAMAGLEGDQEAELFALLQRKAKADVQTFVAAHIVDRKVAEMLAELVSLNGSAEVIATARQCLQGAPPAVQEALQMVESLGQRLRRSYPQVDLYVDLAELRGYEYHTGIVFAAYVDGYGQAIAKGGRYDDIGKVFGRPRAATGFSADLKALINLTAPSVAPEKSAILAPLLPDPELMAKVKQLRSAGERVIYQLQNTPQGKPVGCDRQLVERDGEWLLASL